MAAEFMPTSCFITGTDTGVGKTYIACKLIRHYVALGYRVVGMKPVAAGCELENGVWVNEDVKLLTQASNVQVPHELMNPYCFHAPIAPHIAAEQAGVLIELEVIRKAYLELTQLADIVVVEGAGGLLVPLNANASMADLAALLNIPIMLVVGMRLGCINHTLLTVEVMQNRQLPLLGWVANAIDPGMLSATENLYTLQRHLAQYPQISL